MLVIIVWNLYWFYCP